MTHTCSICLCDIVRSDKTEKLRCKHIYHKDCIGKWKIDHNTCPVCRYVIGNIVRKPTPTPTPNPPTPTPEPETTISLGEYLESSRIVIETKEFVQLFKLQSTSHKIIVGTIIIITFPVAVVIGTIYGILSLLGSSRRV